MGLVARHLEAHGITTLCMASALDIVQAGRAPRTVFVDYPLGHTVGRPFDPEDQLAIVRAGILGLERIAAPGEITTLSNRWSDDDAWLSESSDAAAGDLRQPRDMTPRYQTESDRLLGEGASAG